MEILSAVETTTGRRFVLTREGWRVEREAADRRQRIIDVEQVATLQVAFEDVAGFLPLAQRVAIAAQSIGAEVINVAYEAPLPDGAIA